MARKKLKLPPLHKTAREIIVKDLFHNVNESLDLEKHPWTAEEVVSGRNVPILTGSPEVMTDLRIAYQKAGWKVFAMCSGESLERKFWLEFWPSQQRANA